MKVFPCFKDNLKLFYVAKEEEKKLNLRKKLFLMTILSKIHSFFSIISTKLPFPDSPGNEAKIPRGTGNENKFVQFPGDSETGIPGVETLLFTEQNESYI